MPTIEFSVRGDLLPLLPPPFPATKGVPAWLKEMPLDRTGPTVKRCPPFVDAMTAGYLIPLVADVELTHAEDGIRVDSPFPVPPVLGHFMEQLDGTPFAGHRVLKFNNPWLVKTPAGCSSFFLPPLNVPSLPHIQQVAGIVDTDRFYSEVNIPFLLTLPRGESLALKAGTPIIQVIPFRREEWNADWTPTDVEALEQTHRDLRATEHCYREHLWVKKTYL
jgi:hypothetical protein